MTVSVVLENPFARQTHLRKSWLALITSLALCGCGGGGRGGGGNTGGGSSFISGGTPAATYYIGGTVSGLTTSGLELASGQATLSIGANQTAFTFPTQVSNGSAYDVTIQTQPTNESCTLSGADGTVSGGNVTSIEVSCSPLVGTAVGWIPHLASSDTGAGQTGLFIVSASAMPTASPSWVATTTTTNLGVSQNWVITNAHLTNTYWDVLLAFAAEGTDGHVHLYTLNLSNASATTPTATQVSNLSLASNDQICDWSPLAQTTLTDPTSAFIVLHIAGTGGCSTGGDTWQLVKLTDSATAAPTILAITTSSFVPLYNPVGGLAGMVLNDPATKNLYLYADDTFTSPQTIAGGVSSFTPLVDYYLAEGGGYLGDTMFLYVQETSGQQALWRVPYSGTASQVFTMPAANSNGQNTIYGRAVADGSNIYFYYQGTTAANSNIYELNAMSSTASAVGLINSSVLGGPGLVGLVGSNGTQLVVSGPFQNGSFYAAGYVLVNGGSGQTVTPIGSPLSISGGELLRSSVYMATPWPGSYSNAQIYVSTEQPKASGFGWSSEVLTPAGASVVALTANSAYLSTSYLPVQTNNMLKLTGITATDGSFGGGSLANVPATDPSSPTSLVSSGGSAYIFGDEETLNAISPMSESGTGGVSGVSAGGVISGTATNFALAFNWSSESVQSFSLLNTTLWCPALPFYEISPYYGLTVYFGSFGDDCLGTTY